MADGIINRTPSPDDTVPVTATDMPPPGGYGHIGEALRALVGAFGGNAPSLPAEPTRQPDDPYAGQSVGMPAPSVPGVELGGGAWGAPRMASGEQVEGFRRGSQQLWEQALAMAAINAPPGMPRIQRAMDIYENALPNKGQRPVASVPNEQMPGNVTGLNRGTMSATDFDAVDWRDPVTGQDRLLQAAGLTTRTARPVTGTYENANNQVEQNPAIASEAYVPGHLPGDPGGMNARAKAIFGATEKLRPAIDFQEGQPYNYIDTSVPSARANSLKVTGPDGNVPDAAQMRVLLQIGNNHGLTLSNSADGVDFLNLSSAGEPGFKSGGAVDQLLKAGLEKDIQQAFPGSTVARGQLFNDYTYYAPAIDKAVQGQGRMTRELTDALENMRREAPQEYLKLITSPVIAEKAQANIDRLVTSGQIGKRPDYENFLNLLSGGRLEGFLRYVGSRGYQGLPAAAAVAGPGALTAGAGGSSQDTQ